MATINPLVLVALKKVGLNDDQATKYWDAAVAEAARQGIDANADPEGTATRIVQAVTKFQNTPADTAVSASPYTQKTTAPGVMNQFDPAAMKAAQDEYNRLSLGRNLAGVGSGFHAGIVAGSSGGASQNAWLERQKNFQEQDLQRSIGLQKNLQEQATAGQAAATSISAQDRAQKEFEIKAAKDRAETSDAVRAANSKQQLIDPASMESKVARVLARKSLDEAGFKDSDKLIPDTMSGVSAERVASQVLAVPTVAGAAATAGATKAGIPGTVAESKVKGAVANTVAATQGQVDQATQLKRDVESLKIIKTEYDAETDPAKKASLLRELTRVSSNINDNPASKREVLNLPEGSVLGVSAGGASITNPKAATESTASGVREAAQQDANKNYKTFIEPAANEVMKMLDEGIRTGTFTGPIARFMPNNQQRILMAKLASLNAAAPNAFPPNISEALAKAQASGRTDWVFGPEILGNMTAEQIRQMIADIKSKALLAANYKAGVSTQPATVPMTKNGEIFDIPLGDVERAIKNGFQRKQ